MSLFRRLLNPKKRDTKTSPSKAEINKHLPAPKLPLEEEFVMNFCDNGGKFLYCLNKDEILDAFDSILLENDWYETNVCCFDDNLSKYFDGYNLNFKKDNKVGSFSFMLSACESLVADKGAILLSSNQLKGRKLRELPSDIILFATTSQLVGTISNGMQLIKSNSKNGIPVDITTIRHFEKTDTDDFMTYGNSNKNLYLLLLEDL